MYFLDYKPKEINYSKIKKIFKNQNKNNFK
jgi:hypothetical protein